MKAEESYEIKTPDGRSGDAGQPGQRPPSSGVGKVIVGLLVLLIIAGLVLFRGITARVRADEDVKGDTHQLAVPAVSLAQPKHSAPQEEIILPGNIQAFIDAPIYARTSGYLKRWYVDIGGKVKNGQLFVMIYRVDYWQCAYLIPKGGFDAIKAAGLPDFRDRLKTIAGFAAERIDDAVTDFDQIKLLTVTVDRLKNWARPGLLCIGDAAHAMSPIGGVGINLAIQDAVATANRLGPVMRRGVPRFSDLKAIQKRREFPTRVIQMIQVLAQNRIIAAMFTIFVGGRFARDNAADLRTLASHPFVDLENHSWSHPRDMRSLDDEHVRTEVTRAAAMVRATTGRSTRLFRFPGGNADERTVGLVRALGYTVVHWRWPEGDPDPKVDAERLIEQTLSRTRAGDILIFHVNGRGWHTAEALPRILDGLAARGFRIVSLPEYLQAH